jgi:glyceraldehyde 3-phosphate dehydrogenase
VEAKNKDLFEDEMNFQAEKRKAAVEFIKVVNDLWFDRSIELLVFRNILIDTSVSEVLNLQEYARNFVGKPINIHETLSIAKEIQKLDLKASRIDIGKLAYERTLESEGTSCAEFVKNKLKDILSQSESPISPKDVVLYGFGRIGRLLARDLMLHAGKGEQLRLRAIVTRGNIDKSKLEKRAALLRNDSVHGKFPGTVVADIDKQALIIDGTTVHMISSDEPDTIDYLAYGINNALVIDNSGAFRTEGALGRHLKSAGVSKVMLTAPGKGGVPNIVYGVNNEEFDPNKVDVWSAASCTTNAITPILKVINDNLGVEKGHIETIHSYTNDQNLVDNMHSKYRRGRAAAVNMVITETGAGKAVSKAIPQLEGKLTSSAIRVPVPNGSLAILTLSLENKTSIEEVNALIKSYALKGNLVEQIKYSIDSELVSSDIVGSSATSVFDSHATVVSNDGKQIVVYVWYDNEYGYSRQVIRLAKYIMDVRRYKYY